MHHKETIILGVIALSLSTYVLISGMKEVSKENASIIKESFENFGFSVSQAESITLARNNERVIITKEADRWKIKNSKDSWISTQSIDALFKIFQYGFIRTFEPDVSSKIDEYGLDTPEITFEITLKTGGLMKQLALGKDDVTGLSCYAKVSGESKIFLVGKEYKNELIKFFDKIKDH